MKRILISILIIVSIQSFGQVRQKYGEKLNADLSIDSFYYKHDIISDSIFAYSNDAFVAFRVKYYVDRGLPIPAVFSNFHLSDDLTHKNYVPRAQAVDWTGVNNKPSTFPATASTVGAALLNLSTPISTSLPGINSNGSAFTRTLAQVKSDLSIDQVDNTSDANKPVSTAQQTALNAKQATLVSGSNIKTVNGTSLLGSTDILTTRKVAQADIAATASATSTTTLFTPAVDGFYRIGVYLKITITGTSPVAGPVTITYTSADGSVAQSHVMVLRSVTGTIVTTTVNNSTTTGTVNGDIVIYAKGGVAIQFAIAVSGTFGAGRYVAHLICEQL